MATHLARPMETPRHLACPMEAPLKARPMVRHLDPLMEEGLKARQMETPMFHLMVRHSARLMEGL